MTNRPSLDSLARHHGTDKSRLGHNFTPVYECFFDELRDRPLTVLEIGVYKGAGLRMWRDYFTSGTVVGIDRSPSATDHAEDRVEVFVGDQEDPQFLQTVATQVGPFDLIVDDGGHRAAQQKQSLRCLWPHLNPGGFYVVEDIHTSYLSRYDMGWRLPGTTVETLKCAIDDIHASLHGQDVELVDVAAAHFYYQLCLLQRCVPRV